MKNSIATLLLFLVFIPGFSQSSWFNYYGRATPSVKQQQLKSASFIREIMPEFDRYVILPYKERVALSLRKKTDYPQDYFYARENYSNIIDYVSVRISATSNGKTVVAQSTGERLNAEQKAILNSADPGTDLRINIWFAYKNHLSDITDRIGKVIEASYVVTVIPQVEATYPGGFSKMTDYLTANVINKISAATTLEKMRMKTNMQMASVKFAIDEHGRVVDVKLVGSSQDQRTDRLLLDAIQKMPVWKPAENEKGIKIKQAFFIQPGNVGC